MPPPLALPRVPRLRRVESYARQRSDGTPQLWCIPEGVSEILGRRHGTREDGSEEATGCDGSAHGDVRVLLGGGAGRWFLGTTALRRRRGRVRAAGIAELLVR